MSQRGWAVIAPRGRVYIRTVSDTRRSAIINWLFTEKMVLITRFHTDHEIECMWKDHREQDVDCRRVIVKEAP